jgi:hypothetical protein
MGAIQMETMQTEISGLTRKLDSLTRGLEDLTHLVATTMAGASNGRPLSHSNEGTNLTGYESSYSHHHILDELSSHKDILIDTNGGEMFATKSDRVLSPELQIQRLTAQLTAAYNRIAALEEQLLSRRGS